ncbi:hypothetical protein FSP39_004107 [Pinctada imbricata]|uniref:Uncharacterized protein n=1 Tax=Pinctada imbricata TaxID=66713 RepID=A0AA89C347_PINIB|nr:hypothetical protein FSP39_004107 [Pinctada imbricata]
MTDVTKTYKPDIIICPFLTARVPKEITGNKKTPCLIVHPGIAGDRGSSSIDWAIHDEADQWGVTLLQADDKMDSGDIWCTDNFEMKENTTKTGTYVGDIADSAVECVFESIQRYISKVPPVALSYDNPEVYGRLRRRMKDIDRTIDWEMTSEQILRLMCMSDTQPGAIGMPLMNTHKDPTTYRVFDGHIEHGLASNEMKHLLSKHRPGDVIGKRNGAVLMKTGDEFGIWIGSLKKEGDLTMKQSAAEILEEIVDIRELDCPTDYNDIRVHMDGRVAYVHFDFYNGAMNKFQCARLERVLKQLATRRDIKLVALMGGERFFSTGIHLNAIESSNNKQREAWENINKIDDVIASTFHMSDKVTMAVLQGNAGAGGAMMAAACDVVISHPGVLLTPSYSAMGLFGSEYWTYFFPQRVGMTRADTLVNETSPLLAPTAQEYGLVDYVIGGNKRDFQRLVPDFVKNFSETDKLEKIIKSKKELRDEDWFSRLHLHRQYELSKMKKCFESPAFLNAMTRFVYHLGDDEDLATIRSREREDDMPVVGLSQG